MATLSQTTPPLGWTAGVEFDGPAAPAPAAGGQARPDAG